MKSACVGTGVAFLYLVTGYGYWTMIESPARGLSLGGTAPGSIPSGRAAYHATSRHSEPVARELERLQGTWQLVSSQTNGASTASEQLSNIRVRFDGNRHIVTYSGRIIAHDIRFTIDPTTDPKSTEEAIEQGPYKGNKVRGIYSLEGDTLTSCVSPIGGPRPTAFESQPSSGRTLREFRRLTTLAAHR